ncbi:universal stress protein [Mycolicibacterium doricum]|uniref:Universal stress protein n=1 Tax=Mycolicibacterium doricum TaxID=126673 RepID=A0A1X1SZM8_9MYCO|nr:universal stress protein [Mycolicibacterium doricum]MCV7268292.1 universal stress protein [Mycolicibacterium doricum]ORV37391.1 universal stress protein [Mycolicibacterium doricum]BBZ06515.1 universal stress protein [Mycolicibacterium doricum]
MNGTRQFSPVLVGIDGSDAAINAAMWAVEEAVSRSVPLVLICVMRSMHPSADEYQRELHHAEASLRAARTAVEGTGRPVKVDTEIATGQPAAVLIARSRDAQLVCVGSVGIGRYAKSILGSTATDVAEQADCPVAVIRPPDPGGSSGIRWLLAAAAGAPDDEVVISGAMREARLRGLPVLLLGRQPRDGAGRNELDRTVEQWRKRFDDVHIYPIAARGGVAHFVREHDEPIDLTVIGAADAGELGGILGRPGYPKLTHGRSSVLVVRG